MTTAAPVRGGVRRRIALPRLTVRRLGGLGVVLVLAFAGWLWFRSSSLVAITRVRITGLSGTQVKEIRSALTGEALDMTTLDVSTAKLESAVASFPHIAGIRVRTHFPHGVTIAVDQQIPVATVGSGGAAVAVDGAGLLLPRDVTNGLPSLSVAPDAGGNRVTATSTLGALKVLSAAPPALLHHLASARTTAQHGIVVQLRDGPVLFFGDDAGVGAKWAAADAVLASPDSAGASYIDVSAPNRPAAGVSN